MHRPELAAMNDDKEGFFAVGLSWEGSETYEVAIITWENAILTLLPQKGILWVGRILSGSQNLHKTIHIC